MNTAPVVTRTSTIVSAVFPTREAADRAWDAVIARGYKPSDISAIISESTQKTYTKLKMEPTGDKALQGAGVGGAVGTTVGALAALFLAVGSSLLVPGAGLVLAGPIVAMFVGAGAGGATGTIIGAIVGSDIPEKHVKLIGEQVQKGGILLTVKARSVVDAEAIEMDWKQWACDGTC